MFFVVKAPFFTLSGDKYRIYHISHRLRSDMEIVSVIADNICAKFFCVPQNLLQFTLFFFRKIFLNLRTFFCKIWFCCDFRNFFSKICHNLCTFFSKIWFCRNWRIFFHKIFSQKAYLHKFFDIFHVSLSWSINFSNRGTRANLVYQMSIWSERHEV